MVSIGMRLRYQSATLMLSFPNRRKNDGGEYQQHRQFHQIPRSAEIFWA
jgi:hypothetical protein